MPQSCGVQNTSKRKLPESAPEADTLDTAESAARWLHITPRTLIENARRGKIPCVRINSRVLRFHRATVLAALSK